MYLAKLHDIIKAYLNEKLTDMDSFESFLNNIEDYQVELEKFLEDQYEEQYSPEDLKDINTTIRKGEEWDTDILKHFKMSSNFGELDEKRSKEQERFKKIIIDKAIKDQIKLSFSENYFKLDSSSRDAYNFIVNITDDLNEFKEICEIFKEKDDTKINPKFGKTYSEIKTQIFKTQLTKVKSVIEELSKPMTIEEYEEFYKNNADILDYLPEIDAGKLYSTMESFHIDKDSVKQELEDFQKYKNIGISLAVYKNLGGMYSNPMYKYGTLEDLAKLISMSNLESGVGETEGDSYLSAKEELNNKVTKNTTDKKINQFKDFDTARQMIYFNNANFFMTDPKTGNKIHHDEFVKHVSSNDEKREKPYGGFDAMLESIIDYVAKKEGIKISDVIIYDQKGKETEIPKDVETKFFKQFGDNLMKGEKIIIRDKKTGKFLNTFSTTPTDMGKEHLDKNCRTYKINTICSKFEKDMNTNKTLLESSQLLENSIKEECEKQTKDLYEYVMKSNKGFFGGRGKDEDFNDIEDMLQAIALGEKDKNGDIINHSTDAYINSLASIHTFCQAYLDTNITNPDKEKKCKVIENVYKSLGGMKENMERFKDCQKNIPFQYSLKGKEYSKDELTIFNKNMNIKNEVERKPVFTKEQKDPTNTDQINDMENFKIKGNEFEKKETLENNKSK